MRITISVGTRPQLIKISPLIREIKDEFQFLDTGQHYDYELNRVFYKELNLPEPTFLDIGSGTPAEQTGKALIAIESEIQRFKPEVVVVIGDTNSTLAGALAAAKLRIPLAHIESGLRSFDMNMPEEINRIVVDHISNVLLAPTQNAVRNLLNEGISKKKIFLTQDITVDACLENYRIARKKLKILKDLGLKPCEYILITAHRQENVDNQKNLKKIVNALTKLERRVVFPAHPRTLKNLERFNLLRKLEQNVDVIKPLSYTDFLNLLANSSCVITDSGGIQKEALILKVPCITIRETTEWVETIKTNANVLVGVDEKKIVKEVKNRTTKEFHEFMKNVKNPFGDGHASEQIVDILTNLK